MIQLHSKSSYSVDAKCPRSYWLAYEEFGTGLSAPTKGLEFHLGTALHDGLALIALRTKNGEPVEIDEIATTAYTQVSTPIIGEGNSDEAIFLGKEQGTLVEGLLRGFYKHVWPKLMANYTIEAIELPVLYRHHGKAMMTKGDLILKSLGGQLTYLEYKSTSSKKEEWVQSWPYAIQLHTTMAALQQSHNMEIETAIVQGLYKGFAMKGSQTSIFCYAYKKSGNPPFTRDTLAYEWKPGTRKVPVWELEGGTKKWVETMPEEILADQFPQTPPIFYNEDMAMAHFSQQACRLDDIATAKREIDYGTLDHKKAVLDRYFRQNFDSCVPSFGRPCPYVPICHGNAGDDPLTHGFTPRTTEHLAVFTDLLTETEKDVSS